MPSPLLSKLLQDIQFKKRRAVKDPLIEGLAYDSREVGSNNLFFAIKGEHTDGHRYVAEAERRGAVAVIHQDELSVYRPAGVYIEVENTREALSKVAASYFGYPSRKLGVIGVTGTDGKSTTVWLIQQLLEKIGKRSGFISTVYIKLAGEVQKNPLRQSTPESLEIQAMLRSIREGGNEYAIVEATSHGLSEKTRRLQDVLFDVGVLTNVSHEHLEFHGSVEQYRNDKANLFRALGRGDEAFPKVFGRAFGVVNRDDPHWRLFHGATSVPVYTFSMRDSQADLIAEDFEADGLGSRFTLRMGTQVCPGRLNLPGSYNVENLMAAVLTVSKLTSTTLEELGAHLPSLRGIIGRMDPIDLGQDYRVIVDYAHTPQSFERLLSMLRPQTGGRIISVFGSAGERDIDKRAIQGEIADRYSDVVILTDEDPRDEDPLKILQEIAVGCRQKKDGKDLLIVPDRTQAIRKAFEIALTGDTVLLLGKGHEESIIYADGPRYWNEKEIASRILREVLRERGTYQ
jgi:UDP-N-acetylmuramoyl-L-alanyl-D-glutamate--2,6-diaminopimelate ligase